VLAILLHAHLPFVRHPEHACFLEEDWLFEAITETYLPVLDVLLRLAKDRVPFQLAMTVTPTLGHMLRDALLRARYEAHLARLIALAEDQARRLTGALGEAARFSLLRLFRVREWWREFGEDIPGALGKLQSHGLELVACAATHGMLPLMDLPGSVDAQIRIGIEAHHALFGTAPAGFWLPECAYTPGLDEALARFQIRWTALDSHALIRATPAARNAVWTPVYMPSGVAAFGRDRASAQRVWSANDGYPGHHDYREFYRDAGWDFPLPELLPYLPDGRRKFTGLKLHRITGCEQKEPYDRTAALHAVARHAADFVASCEAQLRTLRECIEGEPVIFAPFDAELFGHWWFEGPEWLEAVIRLCAARPQLPLTSPSSYLASHPTLQVVRPAASSWGDSGHWGVWLDPSNSWIYPHLHAAEQRMKTLASQENVSPIIDRAMRQLARELLLAQSSDWAFLMRAGTAREYATLRTRAHLRRFETLADEIAAGKIDEDSLDTLEARDNLFPSLDWRSYGGASSA
jgi:1,4-alpha-glucan branching enzyme